jgi:transposase
MTKAKAPTLREFLAEFPTEEACLDHLMATRFGHEHDCGKCGRFAKFYRVEKRRSFACNWCGHQVFPTAGSPFDRTRTPLRDWFFVMFLFVTTRNGVAAKEVERQLGVTYKTAWRMCREIRDYMASLDGSAPVGGPGQIVEIDESYIGGRRKGRGTKAGKALVFGAMERGGDVITKVVPNNKKSSLLPAVTESVVPGSIIHSDELMTYRNIPSMGFEHHTANHSMEDWVGPTGGHVQSLEGFWAALKRGINGTHIHVSQKHLPKYLGEFEYRWNMRHVPHLMLDRLMTSFAR